MQTLKSLVRIALGIVVGGVVLILVLFLLFGDIGAHKREAKQDAKILDALLATSHVDRVEFVSWDGQTTNAVIGTDAQKILSSLGATNRMRGKEFKDESRRVYFMNDTQPVLELTLDDSGLWHYGVYTFCLRSP